MAKEKENGKGGGAETKTTPITSLLQLPSRDVPVKIEIEGQDDPIVIPCRALTLKRYQEIGRMVADVQPPSMAGKTGMMYDWQNPDYRAKQEAVQEQRNMLRLAEFVQADIPGASLQEKADWMADNLEMGVIYALKSAMDRTLQGGGAAVNARAETFHPV